MEHLWLLIKLMVLLGVANGTPVFARKLFGDRFAWPLDGGLRFFDARPLLGPSKTVRGVALALTAAALAAPALDLEWTLGLTVGAFAMLGDLASSFAKRRLGRAISSQALGLDQIPESLFPLLAVQQRLGLQAWDIALLVGAFLVLELLLSRLLFRVGLREQPY
jgi:CDP-2,3-bis-(O-geranylgeranyl)-sn-glycerol synthase